MPSKINLELVTEEERLAIEARRRYQKQWREKNQDKVKANSRRFWLKKPLKSLQNRPNKESRLGMLITPKRQKSKF